jgi:tetratricopeptide (TPR) repeat protein
MMKLAYIKKFVGIFTLCLICSAGIFAQEKNDAISLFNQGVEFMKANDPKALETFEKCVAVCEQIGDSAADIKSKAVSVIPDLYYKKAFNTLTVDKNIPLAVKEIRSTIQVAEKYSDTSVKENSEKLLVQAYTNMASGYVAAKESEKAIQAFDSVLMINPNHMPSLYNKALMYRGLDNAAKFGESIDVYIGKLKATGDTAKIAQANKIARDYYRIAGGKANQANKLTEALASLNTALKYGSDNSVHYQLASVYNKQKKFALAAENALKGLSLEPQDTPEAKAKYYYELGTAQAGLGKTTEACESLKNAMYGPFLNAAKAQRTNMKCQ